MVSREPTGQERTRCQGLCASLQECCPKSTCRHLPCPFRWSPEAAKEMEKLKADAGRLKSRAAELTQAMLCGQVQDSAAALQHCTPKESTDSEAVAAEHAVQHLGEQRDQLRGELQGTQNMTWHDMALALTVLTMLKGSIWAERAHRTSEVA
eukprot:Skav212491  [mRNA]  locus=scaffold6473:43565:48542:- [translate_table: standard]